MFIYEYLRDFNATQAAIRCGYSERTAYAIGSENLKKPEIAAAIKEEIDKKTVGYDEMLIGLTEQARASLGDFFRIVEEWTFYPLPTDDIIDVKETEHETLSGETEIKPCYFVRRVSIDTYKLVDPKYAPLLKKFSDSPKNGMSIELYDKQSAWQNIAKLRGLIVDKSELSGKDGGPVEIKTIEIALPPDDE